MRPHSSIRALVSRVLSIHQLTPDLEQAINNELTRLGHLPEGDAEVLELLMEALDSGLVRLVPSSCTGTNPLVHPAFSAEVKAS